VLLSVATSSLWLSTRKLRCDHRSRVLIASALVLSDVNRGHLMAHSKCCTESVNIPENQSCHPLFLLMAEAG
jgi:hypothetical protein